MPTISNKRALRAAALLFLFGASGTAGAGPTIEIDARTEAFADRAACEQALERRRSAALSRLAALPPAERRGNGVGEMKRSDGEHLSYSERVDLASGEPSSDMPQNQTELFTCRGARLEHRIEFGAGGR